MRAYGYFMVGQKRTLPVYCLYLYSQIKQMLINNVFVSINHHLSSNVILVSDWPMAPIKGYSRHVTYCNIVTAPELSSY